ncbi:MAG TPA: methyltransferase domain-containing protein [Ilumatobacter sp.]|nr:methyltransferase domain-containing protein [Ilumatobacter sp.]
MDDDATRWNARYVGLDADEPARPLGLDALTVPAGGLCLDVACGLGAQAVWAALNGFDVIALDASDVAIDATKRFATAHDVDPIVDARVHDLVHGLPGDVIGECDLVICQKYRDPNLYPKLVNALNDDGVLVVTVLSVIGVDGEVGPFHAPPGDLVLAFRDLDVEIVGHHEANGLATLVARRKSA